MQIFWKTYIEIIPSKKVSKAPTAVFLKLLMVILMPKESNASFIY